MMVWYCPEDGLEYRCLLMVGWRIEHRLTVDGIQWVKLVKDPLNKSVLSCLN